MKIGVIVAMGKELRLLLPLLSDVRVEDTGRFTLRFGRLGRHEVCVTQCGIGKVNAALSTDMLIRYFSPELVINTGVAGGADDSMHVLDVLVATAVAYHDVWCGPGTEWGAAAGCPPLLLPYAPLVGAARLALASDPHFREGLLCSGDIFVSKAEEVALIKSRFPEALGVDMESGAIAQTCALASVPFGIIRVISDTPGQAENISQYENFWSDAPAETFRALTRILDIII